ncbi:MULTISPECIES: hypothetical protein [unclassified Paraburkholderia]|nr:MULTISPECIES: hypothetical protein [unclassified Paraburkholderia]
MTTHHFNIETNGIAQTSFADTFANLPAKGKPGRTRSNVPYLSNEASQ